jgi:DNA-directed RNA polymerase specialized sigma24 family protein
VTREELEAIFIELLEKKELDRVRKAIRRSAAGLPRDIADDCFQHACMEVVNRREAGQDLSNVAGLLVTIGRRRVAAIRKEVGDAEDANDVLERRIRDGVDWPHDESRQEALARGIAWVRRVVEGWPADNLRRVMMTLLDAAADGEQLQPADVARRLDIPRTHAGTYRDRAVDRVRKAAEDAGVSWETVATAWGEDEEELAVDSDETGDDSIEEDAE